MRERRKRADSRSPPRSSQADSDRSHRLDGAECRRRAAASCDAVDWPEQTFQLTKSVILRLIGFIYVVAFKIAVDQNAALMGSDGLTPVIRDFELVKSQVASPWESFGVAPSLFWLVPLTDESLLAVECIGLACGALLISGVFSAPLCLVLWLLYFSIVSVASGTRWYSYGWESQLLETGFLASFLCAPLDSSSPPSLVVLWLFRWLAARLSLSAGLVKVRGISCWTQRTCYWHYFETQPSPSPFAFAWHFLPKAVLSRVVDLDILVQLFAVWLVLVPGWGFLRYARRAGGLIQVLHMLNLALSGNFGFANYLTIVPALACIDDVCWRPIFACARRLLMLPGAVPCPSRRASRSRVEAAQVFFGKSTRLVLDVLLVVVIGFHSVPVVRNMFQSSVKQAETPSQEPVSALLQSLSGFRLVNAYGAFGNVAQRRYEAIISVTHDGHTWHELEFPCKPGPVDRRPCVSAPYLYRLDSEIWFLGLKPHRKYLERRETWMWTFLAKVLEGDEKVLGLLAPETASGPAYFPDGPRGRRALPYQVKVDMWHYAMRAPLWTLLEEYWDDGMAVWWVRTHEELLIPPLQRDSEQLTWRLSAT